MVIRIPKILLGAILVGSAIIYPWNHRKEDESNVPNINIKLDLVEGAYWTDLDRDGVNELILKERGEYKAYQRKDNGYVPIKLTKEQRNSIESQLKDL